MPSPPTLLATVVPLKRGPSAWPAVVRQAWEALDQALGPVYAAWGDAADDALFRQAERGDEEGGRYFEAMRVLRKVRPQLQADIQARYRQEVDRWLRAPEPAAARPAAALGAPIALTLVGHEELEEALAVDAMADRAQREAGPQWEAFRQRLARVLDRPVGPTPLEPEALAQALRAALDAVEAFDTPVRLTLLKLFERQAWPVLATVVVDLNAQMAQQGILPHLSAAAPRMAPRSSGPEAAEAVPLGASAPAVPAPASALPLAGWTPAIAQDLVALLAQLRPSSEGAPAPSPRQWRDQILAQLPTSLRQPAHDQAIDLVAMVFEFLLRDDLMPTPVQALLARLQLPYLRVAVLDPHGFAQPHHPARQLLDVLSQVGQTWTAADDRQGQWMALLRASVDHLSEASDTDLSVFVAEQAAWQARLAQQTARAARASDRAIAQQAGLDKREAAQRAVAQAFVQRLGSQALPSAVSVVLQHWKAAMTLLWLREGPDSSAFRGAVFLLDQVRAMAQVHPGSEAAERLDRMRPALRLTLHRGLGLLAFDHEVLSALVATFDAFLGERTGHPHPRPVRTPIPDLPAMPEPTEPPSPQARPAPAANVQTPALAAPVAQEPPADLPLGTWLAFEQAGVAHRGKLSWISPFTRRWLMVSAQGLKIADLDPHEVTRQMAAGTAQVIPSEGLVRRAQDAAS